MPLNGNRQLIAIGLGYLKPNLRRICYVWLKKIKILKSCEINYKKLFRRTLKTKRNWWLD